MSIVNNLRGKLGPKSVKSVWATFSPSRETHDCGFLFKKDARDILLNNGKCKI